MKSRGLRPATSDKHQTDGTGPNDEVPHIFRQDLKARRPRCSQQELYIRKPGAAEASRHYWMRQPYDWLILKLSGPEQKTNCTSLRPLCGLPAGVVMYNTLRPHSALGYRPPAPPNSISQPAAVI
jgi:transposase InsO family protein